MFLKPEISSRLWQPDFYAIFYFCFMLVFITCILSLFTPFAYILNKTTGLFFPYLFFTDSQDVRIMGASTSADVSFTFYTLCLEFILILLIIFFCGFSYLLFLLISLLPREKVIDFAIFI